MRTFFALTICTILLTGCNKGKTEFTLKGVLTDSTFGQTLSGANVKLYEIEAGTLTSTLIGQSTTDASGSYSFTFARNQAESYTLVAEKGNYFAIDETIFFSDMSIEQDNIRNYSTTAKAWVKLRFKNEAPAEATDLLSYQKQSGKSDCPECHPDTEQYLTGIVDTVINCTTDGNTTFSYLYNVIGGSQGVKTVNAVALDTTEITLNY